MNNGLVVLSLFDGMSAGMLALERAGIAVSNYYASEVDKWAIKVSSTNYPNIVHIGDVTKVSYKDGVLYTENGEYNVGKIDLLIGGSPCFTAGTSILTKQGYKNIEDINIGDFVLTHTNTYKEVLNIGSTFNKTITVKAQGSLYTETTLEHPYLARVMTKKQRIPRSFSKPEWIEAGKLTKNHYVGTPICQKEDNPLELTEEDCWIIGRYIADGHIRNDQRKERINGFYYSVILSVGESKLQAFKDRVKSSFSCYKHSESVYRCVFHSKRLVEVIKSIGCGQGAENKDIPGVLMALPKYLLKEVVDGYMSGDGSCSNGCYKATTISRKLALSLGRAITKVYEVGTSVSFSKRPPICVIGGRTVNQKDTYLVSFYLDTKPTSKAYIEDGIIWNPIKSVNIVDETQLVYNLEVDEDNSYTANNVIVHNCQSVSNLGDGSGLDGKSGLFFHYLRIKDEVKPKKFLLENVVGNKKAIAEMSEMMGVEPKMIDSNLLSAQNRKRYYWSDIEYDIPSDKGIMLKDVLESNPGESSKLSDSRMRWLLSDKGQATLAKRYANLDGEKASCLTARSDASWNSNYVTRDGVITKLTCIEYERLQTVPEGYTSCVSDSQRYKILGNGWTVEVIAHIFKGLLAQDDYDVYNEFIDETSNGANMKNIAKIQEDIKIQINNMIDSEMYSHEEIQEFREEMGQYTKELQEALVVA